MSHKSSNAAVPFGTSGVIVTCDGGKERGAARDVARNLREAYERRFGTKDVAQSDGRKDIEDELENELASLREDAKKPMFKECALDLRASTFLAFDAGENKECSIADLVHDELERAMESRETRGRHVLRMLPVDVVCFAGLDEIIDAAKGLVAKHFSSEKEQTFAISFERRANNSVERGEVIKAIADMIKQPPNKVNLGNPDVTIMVEVIKGVACLSVVRDYERLCKYNLRMVAMTEDEREHAKRVLNGNKNPPAHRAKEDDEVAPKDDDE